MYSPQWEPMEEYFLMKFLNQTLNQKWFFDTSVATSGTNEKQMNSIWINFRLKIIAPLHFSLEFDEISKTWSFILFLFSFLSPKTLSETLHSSARFVSNKRNDRIYTSGCGRMLLSFNVIHRVSSIKVSRVNLKSVNPRVRKTRLLNFIGEYTSSVDNCLVKVCRCAIIFSNF